MILFEDQTGFRWPDTIDQERVGEWLRNCLQSRGFTDGTIVYNLIGREQMRTVNRQVYGRDYDTDTITLAYPVPGSSRIDADIYISVDQIRDNAVLFSEPFEREFLRVLVHSLLHAMGWEDATPQQKSLMHRQEDQCLEQFK